MSRAILLPTPGDPYICGAWLASYKKFQKQHIDKLYVCLNSPLEDVVYNYVLNMFKEVDATIIEHRNFIDHGPSITQMIEICHEDYVFLSEDDFFVQDPIIMDTWFKVVEAGEADILGSMRGCTGQEIIKRTAEKFNLTGKEAQQPNLWPALLVSSLNSLKKTDMNFAAKSFEAGKYIRELDLAPTEKTAGDTFVWASIQLRALGFHIQLIPHYRWIDVNIKKLYPPPWIHIGSGSASLNGHLLDERMIPICNPNSKPPRNFPNVPDEGIRTHFEAKFAGWKVLNQEFTIPKTSPAVFFNQKYKEAVERTIKGCELRSHMIGINDQLFRQILAPILEK